MSVIFVFAIFLDHWLNVARLLLWYSTGPAGMSCYYNDCVSDIQEQKQKQKLEQKQGSGHGGEVGYRCVLCATTILLEALLWVKCGLEDFTTPFPVTVIRSWQVVLAVILFQGIRLSQKQKQKIMHG